MRTVYLGTSPFAAAVLRRVAESPHRPSLVVTRPDAPRGRGRKLAPPPVADTARELGIEVFQPANVNEPESVERIAAAEPEAVLLCAFGALIKEPLLSGFGPIRNVHPSLLPRWRGAAPVERAIMAGDDETGVTIMAVTEDLDAGPIYLVGREPIGPDDTYGTVAERLQALSGDLLVRTLDEQPDPTEQPEEGVTYAEKITAEDRTLDPARPAVELERTVRALTPHIGARIELNGELLGVRRARVVPPGAEGALVVRDGGGRARAARGPAAGRPPDGRGGLRARSPLMPTPARRVAHRVVLRVAEQGAFADQALHAEAAKLEPRERALARQLAFGTIQRRRTLDHLIAENITANCCGRSRSSMRVRAWSTTISVCTHTSPSGCHSGSCGQPTSACNSGNSRLTTSSSSASAQPSDGRAAWSSSFSISPQMRSAGRSSSGSRRQISRVPGSIESSKRAANCTARSTRRLSSPNVPGSTARRIRASNRAAHRTGRYTSSVSGSHATALIVKSRRRAASSNGRSGSPVTSKPRCPRPIFDSRRGSATSMPATL